MTVLEGVADYLKRVAPRAVCDDCLASGLKITPRQHANHKTIRLQEEPDFDRRVDLCSECGRAKKVIRYVRGT